jgi:hypothetical protein
VSSRRSTDHICDALKLSIDHRADLRETPGISNCSDFIIVILVIRVDITQDLAASAVEVQMLKAASLEAISVSKRVGVNRHSAQSTKQ